MKEKIQDFLRHPFPLWEKEITQILVNQTWQLLNAKGLSNSIEYHTAWFQGQQKNESLLATSRTEVIAGSGIFLEFPSQNLQDFYEENGVDPLSESEILQGSVKAKLQKALEILSLVEGVWPCICQLVRAIQVLRQTDLETDVSYSHPKIPFTLFVSVCEDQKVISRLRVAESILHEAMHLKLTLLEKVIPLIQPNARGRFFSPWRDELRPARGVLHGIFVFRAVMEFYTRLELKPNEEASDYLRHRIHQTKQELGQLSDFDRCPDLTNQGIELAQNLLSLS